MIIGINGQKTLTKHISCKSKCKSDVIKCNSNKKWDKKKCWYVCKNLKECHVCKKKIIFGILNNLQNIWDKLWFSCDVAHYEISSVFVSQKIFTSTDKIFPLEGGLRTKQ